LPVAISVRIEHVRLRVTGADWSGQSDADHHEAGQPDRDTKRDAVY
jgi:hypothetical protein